MKKITILIMLLLFLILFGFSKEPGKKKFQVEVFAGFSTLNPGDLNANPNTYAQVMKFWYEDRYEYYARVGYIQSFSKNQEGGFQTIKYSLPFGFRLKYYVFKPLALSLGFKYLAPGETSDFRHQAVLTENNGAQTIYIQEYSPHTISAKGLIPTLGIHFEKRLSNVIGLEFFVCGGPLFAQLKWNYDSRTEETSNGNVTSTSTRNVVEKGSGTGVALDGGFRINYSMGKHLGLFVEAGYTYQVVNSLQGPGHDIQDGEIIDQWEGEWGMKEYYNADYWGIFDMVLASNYWEYGESNLWVRRFKLDLSGFQARIGITYRF
jgi:hypothetical protein